MIGWGFCFDDNPTNAPAGYRPQFTCAPGNAPMDMTDQLHSTMRLKAVELFAPSGFKLLNEGVELAEKVRNYERVIGDVHSSYYSHEVVEAAQASRVGSCPHT
jgi:hypothetical protein